MSVGKLPVFTVASSREDAWIETFKTQFESQKTRVASSREDAWIETILSQEVEKLKESRPPARTRGLKPISRSEKGPALVASSREDAWIETYWCWRS